MTTFSVIGSGFGLYGYVPAIARLPNARIRLPECYRAKLESRKELAFCRPFIDWVASREQALEESDLAVLALPPERQLAWIDRSLESDPHRRLLLEKPLGPTPRKSSLALDKLFEFGCDFRIGYLFRYTDWFQDLKAAIGRLPTAPVTIRWRFRAAHFISPDSSAWKADRRIGGGALSFYGIHLLACAAEIGYSRVECMEFDEDHTRFTCAISGIVLPKIVLEVSTNSNEESLFEISQSAVEQRLKPVCRLRDPLRPNAAAPAPGMPDSRISFLETHIRSLLDTRTNLVPQWYHDVIELWAEISSFESTHRLASPMQGLRNSA